MIFKYKFIYYILMIFKEEYIKKTISLLLSSLRNNTIDELLLSKLKHNFENKCIENGFVKKDSIEIKKRSVGYKSNVNNLNELNFDVYFTCLLCNPTNNSIVECKVIDIIKPAIIAEAYPLTIIIPETLNINKKLYNSINKDSVIEIRIINSQIILNEKEIQVIGILSDKKNNIITVKPVDKKEIVFEENEILEEEPTYEDSEEEIEKEEIKDETEDEIIDEDEEEKEDEEELDISEEELSDIEDEDLKNKENI